MDVIIFPTLGLKPNFEVIIPCELSLSKMSTLVLIQGIERSNSWKPMDVNGGYMGTARVTVHVTGNMGNTTSYDF